MEIIGKVRTSWLGFKSCYAHQLFGGDCFRCYWRACVEGYIRQLEAGNFDVAIPLRKGVFELRLDFGPSY